MLSWPATPAYAQIDADTPQSETEGEPSIRIDAAREILTKTLPPGATREEETAYLLEREQAAFAVGSGRQRLEALRRLVELHAGTPQVYRYWGYLWREEWRSGNQQQAVEIGEKLLADGKRSLPERTEGAALLVLDYIYLGDRNRAAQTLRRADSLFAEYRAQGPNKASVDRLTAAIETARAVSLRMEGRYADAETAIRKSIEAIDLAVQATKGVKREGFVSLYESNLRYRAAAYGQYVTLLTEIGRHVEAEALARQGLQQTTAEETVGASVGYWYARIARTQVAQRRYTDAVALLDRALGIYAEAGLGASSERVLGSRTLKLQALLGLERWPEADAEYAAMLAATKDDAAARQTISSALLRAMLLALTGHGAESVTAIDSVLQYRRRLYGEAHPATLEAKAVRGMCLQAQGTTGAALAAYREAFDGLFSASAASTDLATRGLRGLYLPLTLSAFLRLVAAESDAGRADPALAAYAFTVTDRLRSSTVQQAIADSASRSVVASDPQLGELVRSEQQARNSRRD
ncbi:MAG: hypothetical protein JWO68_4152, partial [Actinomycetia bacterium]|nr:hypothetical protein [Actinomycetes bacterium]